MSLNIPTQQLLSDGQKWFAYSGVRTGGVALPASLTMITIPNTGLRDSLVCIQPYQGDPITTGANDALGLLITIDDVEVYKSVPSWQRYPSLADTVENKIELFVPRQSKLEVISLNNANNNNMEWGANVIAYFM